jgi:hypothetical protein
VRVTIGRIEVKGRAACAARRRAGPAPNRSRRPCHWMTTSSAGRPAGDEQPPRGRHRHGDAQADAG